MGRNDGIQGDGIFRVTCSVISKEDDCQLQSTEIQKRQLDVSCRESIFYFQIQTRQINFSLADRKYARK